MNHIKHWQKVAVVYDDPKTGFAVIRGYYSIEDGASIEDKNKSKKALGVFWGMPHPFLPDNDAEISPCIIPRRARNAMLSGLLNDALTQRDYDLVRNITDAIAFFQPSNHSILM